MDFTKVLYVNVNFNLKIKTFLSQHSEIKVRILKN